MWLLHDLEVIIWLIDILPKFLKASLETETTDSAFIKKYYWKRWCGCSFLFDVCKHVYCWNTFLTGTWVSGASQQLSPLELQACTLQLWPTCLSLLNCESSSAEIQIFLSGKLGAKTTLQSMVAQAHLFLTLYWCRKMTGWALMASSMASSPFAGLTSLQELWVLGWTSSGEIKCMDDASRHIYTSRLLKRFACAWVEFARCSLTNTHTHLTFTHLSAEI